MKQRGTHHIGVDDIEDLALGAVVLGAGGGGDPHVAILMLRQAIEKCGPVEVVHPDDLDPDSAVFPIAMVGAPTVVVEKFPNGTEFGVVLRTLSNRLGVTPAAVVALESGGLNALFPLVVAAELGLPCVDSDGMRRAFPRLEQTLYTLGGVSSTPIAMADVHGNCVSMDCVDNAMSERFVRSSVTEMGMNAVIAAYAMTGRQCAQFGATGSLTLALELGRRLRAVRSGVPRALESFLDFAEARVVFTGTVTDLERNTAGGWARALATLQHLEEPERVMTIQIQNENLVAFEADQPVVTVPDLITMVDIETATPMTTESLRYGQRVNVLALPAEERWLTADGLGLAGPRAFGYDIDYVPFGVHA